MYVSMYGLAGAALMFALGLAGSLLLKNAFKQGRENLPLAERAEAERTHAKAIKWILALELTVLPVIGYIAGMAIFR